MGKMQQNGIEVGGIIRAKKIPPTAISYRGHYNDR
jgi:hypothetical protein